LQDSNTPRLSYSVHTMVNLRVRVERGPVNISFTGPGWAFGAPERIYTSVTLAGVSPDSKFGTPKDASSLLLSSAID
jgi:hypothetical protein